MYYSKNLFSSKTFWVAVIQALIAGVAVYSNQYPDLGYILLAKSALDIALRYVTTQSVRL